MKKTNKGNLPALMLLLALLMLWQLGAMKVNAAYILPTPVQILQRLWELREPLFLVHLPATMQVTLLGLAISLVLGLGLAVLMDASAFCQKAIYPLVVASQTIPTTAIAPLSSCVNLPPFGLTAAYRIRRILPSSAGKRPTGKFTSPGGMFWSPGSSCSSRPSGPVMP